MALTTVESLRQIIICQLSNIIGERCILVDAPYYDNIGDVLIWAGTRQYLEDNGHKTIYTCSYRNCVYPSIDNDVTVLFQGGGNLGDLYPEHSEFLMRIVNHYPHNRIVILPQTVYYQNPSLELMHITQLIEHGDVYLCARDNYVYNKFSKLLGEKCKLVPDMAFCLSVDKNISMYLPEKEKTLCIERKDSERCGSLTHCEGDKLDWPTIENLNHRLNLINRFFLKLSFLYQIPFVGRIICTCWDFYASHFFVLGMVREGVEFISPYQSIVTTRLHGCILSCLLSKNVRFVDNNYGKNSHFYKTWLKDFSNVQLIDNE